MQYLLIFISSFLIAYCLTPRILLLSLKKRLVNNPNQRTVHTQTASRLGGAVFFPSAVIPVVIAVGTISFANPDFFSQERTVKFLLGISALFIMYLMGMADDVGGIRYRRKFIIQALAAGIIVFSGLWIKNLHGIYGIHEVPAWIGCPLTIFLILFITNAINLIDGLDGLAAGLSILILSGMAYLLYAANEQMAAMLAMGTLGMLLAFIRYNLFGLPNKNSKIFMGDSGSLFLGGVLSMLTLKLCEGATAQAGAKQILIAWTFLFVPCIDVLRVMLHRLKNGKPVFSPDKNHIHHKFLALGCSHRRTLLYILGLALFFIGLNLTLELFLPAEWIMLSDVIIWTLGNIILTKQMEIQAYRHQ